MSWMMDSMTKRKNIGPLIHKPNPQDLEALKGDFEAGKVLPVIDKIYSLGESGYSDRLINKRCKKGWSLTGAILFVQPLFIQLPAAR